MKKITPQNVHEVIGNHMLADGYDMVFDMERSHGSYLYDSKHNRELLDFFTCFASSPIGYNHPRLTTPEFLQKLSRAAVNKPANSDLYTVEMAEFVETFAELAAPSYLPHFFFIDGGTLAVENALKVAFDYRMHKLGFICEPEDYPEKGGRVIHFKEAFHGRSGYTLSLTNTFDPRKTCLFPKFRWPRVSNPKLRFPLTDDILKEVQAAEAASLNQIREALQEHGDEIAALIIEPIQGEGGDNHFRPEFLQELRRICTEADILMIVDEVQTGVGLTGTMWAFEQFGIEPDIVAFGKKTQICGIMVNKSLDDDPANVFLTPSRINSTFGGNLVDMVRCTEYLRIIQEEHLIDNARIVGAQLLSMLQELAARYPTIVSNVRGRGLMIAFDAPSSEVRDRILNEAMEKGLFALASGSRSVRLRPPLNLSRDEAARGVAIFDSVIHAL